MHVCHLIHSIGPGGAEQVLVDLARASSAGGFTISVVALVGDTSSENARALMDQGVPVRSVGLGTRWDPRALHRALGIVRGLRPDVLHTHLKHADLVGAWVARRLGVPQVSTLHLIEQVTPGISVAKRWLGGKVRERAAARTLTVSEAQRDWYLRHFPARPDLVLTVRNGVSDPPQLSAAERSRVRDEFGLAPDELLVTNVAIMRPGKGHDDLLAAVRGLPADLPVHVLLVGDGSERARLEAVVAGDPRLEPRVTFAGYRTDVPRLLAATDVVVHPSLADALPTALIHALAAGVPTIASRVGGIPEVVGPETGVLVPAGAPRVLTEALDALLRDGERRAAMGRAARRRYDEEYDARVWARRLGALYREVTAPRGGSSGGAGDDPVVRRGITDPGRSAA